MTKEEYDNISFPVQVMYTKYIILANRRYNGGLGGEVLQTLSSNTIYPIGYTAGSWSYERGTILN